MRQGILPIHQSGGNKKAGHESDDKNYGDRPRRVACDLFSSKGKSQITRGKELATEKRDNLRYEGSSAASASESPRPWSTAQGKEAKESQQATSCQGENFIAATMKEPNKSGAHISSTDVDTDGSKG